MYSNGSIMGSLFFGLVVSVIKSSEIVGSSKHPVAAAKP